MSRGLEKNANKRIRIAIITYLNTLPFIYGLEHSSISRQIELISCSPAQAAQKIISGEVDLGIVPSAIIPLDDKFRVVSDYCIGAQGDVDSVLICSGLPLSEIKEIYLDSESKTSALLTKVLAEKFWDITPVYIDFKYSAEALDISKSYLLIGDKALRCANEFEYRYDLAAEWFKFTGKPFVFACWTANKELPEAFLKEFNAALAYGVENIEACVEWVTDFPKDIAIAYLKNNISYHLDANKKAGLSEFLRMAYDIKG